MLIESKMPRLSSLLALAVALRLPVFAADLEYSVKAAFLLNFTKFIDWPPKAFANPQSPLEICILGKSPFGSALGEVLQGETANSRKLVSRQIIQRPLPQTCQVLFIDTEQKNVPAILAGLPPGILTVGEGDRFLKDGGIIALVVDNRRVRFDVSQTAAEAAGLKPSSKLLTVARSVEK